MRTLSLSLLALLTLFILNACGGAANDDEEAAATNNPCPKATLVGSWELISIADDAPALTGDFDTDPEYVEAPTLKILNRTHWMFIRQSSDQFIHAQGGPYSLEPGGRYTEHVEYSALPGNIGKSFSFDCRLEGDSLWHHVGGLGDTRYREVWRRVR